MKRGPADLEAIVPSGTTYEGEDPSFQVYEYRTARKPHTCDGCGHPIAVGEMYLEIRFPGQRSPSVCLNAGCVRELSRQWSICHYGETVEYRRIGELARDDGREWNGTDWVETAAAEATA